MNNDLLKFGKGNAKLGVEIGTFSLPAGDTCPFANECKCSVAMVNGKRKIIDGPNQKFRCFAASMQAVYTSLYNNVWHNFNLLKECDNDVSKMAELINKSLPKHEKIRVHVSGDFFNENYLKAWIDVAKNNKSKLFYAYTKSVKYIINCQKDIPDNLVITCSYGGLDDDLILRYGLKRSMVVYTPEEADALDLKIDHDDSLAMDKNVKAFALLIHGSQPKDSFASNAIKKLKERNIKFSYSTADSK